MNSDGHYSALYLETLRMGTFWVVPARNSLRRSSGSQARDAEAEGTKHQASCEESGSLRTQVSQFHSNSGYRLGIMCHSRLTRLFAPTLDSFRIALCDCHPMNCSRRALLLRQGRLMARYRCLSLLASNPMFLSLGLTIVPVDSTPTLSFQT